MSEFVLLLLDSRDNIIDQLLLLKKYQKNKEVKKYINYLLNMNLTLYGRYCLNKYYFDLEEEEVPIPDCYYPHLRAANKTVENILKKADRFEDKIELLVKHKTEKEVKNYIDDLINSPIMEIPYARYVILKQVYGLELEQVRPTAESLRIRLIKIIPQGEKKRERRKQVLKEKKFKIKQKVLILNGPFKDIKGIITKIDHDNCEVLINLFGKNMLVKVKNLDIEVIK